MLCKKCKINKLVQAAVLFFFVSISHSVFSQTRLDGRLMLTGGFGTGLYLVSTNQVGDKDVNALAGSMRLGFEYGFGPRFIGGFSLFRNGFATNKDSNTSVSNANFNLTGLYLLAGKSYSGLYVIGGLGFTNLNYNNRNKKEEGKSGGISLMLGLRYQRFFGEHLGWFVEGTGSGYQLKKLEAKYTAGKTSINEKWEMGITGGELKLGLVWAFGKNKKE